MKFQRCENGHFYDADAFSSCPHCKPASDKPAGSEANRAEIKYEPPVSQQITPSPAPQPETVIGRAPYGTASAGPADLIAANGLPLVVGWLVAIEGKHFGEDFKLKAGANYIGRGNGMDVQLASDPYVSREKHGILTYDPNTNSFFVQPGASKNPFYLNDKVVTEQFPLSSGDVLMLGDSKLLFTPLCTDKFNWSMAKK